MFKTLKLIASVFIIFTLFVIIRGGILEHIHLKEKPKLQKTFYKDFNKFFKGVIIKIKRRPPKRPGGVQTACYKLRLIESSTRYFSPGSNLNATFCLIDFPYAEVMSRDLNDVQLGDTCYYNGITDCFAIKVANQKWRVQKPDIDIHDFLLPPYSSMPKYDSIALTIRKIFYPRIEQGEIDQINYYWQKSCKNEKPSESLPTYNLTFYNYDTWLKENNPVIMKRRLQRYYYMIQIAEYKQPLDMRKLNAKFIDEPIIWIYSNKSKKNKYYLNRRLYSKADALNYLVHIKSRFNLTSEDMAVIKKIKLKQELDEDGNPIGYKSPSEKMDENTPDIQLIPKPKSIYRYAWIVFIAFTFINVLSHQSFAAAKLKKDKVFAKGFKQYAFGLLVFFNIWLILIGVGLATGLVDNVFAYVYEKGNPLIIASNIYLIMILFAFTRWVFVGNGAETLAELREYPDSFFTQVQSADGIRLIWGVIVFMGFFFVFARMFF